MSTVKNLVRAVAIISAGSAMNTAVQAQEEIDIRTSIYGGAHGSILDSDWNHDDEIGWFVGAEIPVAERWGLSLERMRVNADRDFAAGATAFETTRLGGNYYFKPRGKWQPFLTTGIGHLHLDGSNPNISAGKTTFDFGAGVKRFVTDNLFVRGDARTVHVSGVNNLDLAVNVGVGYAFGAKPGKPAPAPVAVADPDSDGDGVPDSRDKCPNTPRELAVDADGCPILDSSQKRQQLQVNFDFDKADIKPEYYGVIGEFAQFLTTYANTSVVIEGHTDSTGPDSYNQGLSERRAQAVVNRLVTTHRIPASRVSAVGYGESRPLADNNTRENRAKNRRIMADVSVEIQEQRKR